MKIKNSLAAVMLLFSASAMAQQPLSIARQGHFSVGGKTLQREGSYDNSKFVGWATQVETGQSARVNHAFVDYQIPADAKQLPLVFVHGFPSPPTSRACMYSPRGKYRQR